MKQGPLGTKRQQCVRQEPRPHRQDMLRAQAAGVRNRGVGYHERNSRKWFERMTMMLNTGCTGLGTRKGSLENETTMMRIKYHAPKAIKSVINPGQKRQACGESPDVSDQNVGHQQIYTFGFGSSQKEGNPAPRSLSPFARPAPL